MIERVLFVPVVMLLFTLLFVYDFLFLITSHHSIARVRVCFLCVRVYVSQVCQGKIGSAPLFVATVLFVQVTVPLNQSGNSSGMESTHAKAPSS